jgi:hypothetical protein
MHHLRLLLMLFSLLFITPPLLAEETVTLIRGPKVLKEQAILNVYFEKVLNTALARSAEAFGPFKLERTAIYMEQERSLKALASGQFIDVQWCMTSREREELVHPIRIPLVKGLLGCRVFLIKRERLKDFEDVKYIQQLLPLTAGQAHDWPDTTILEHNGFKVVKGRDSVKLTRMLELGRFDFFPRGLTEAPHEVKMFPDADLMIEPNLMLVYPSPIYFFVKNENHELAKRLEMGLENMIQDGSFDRLFFQLLEDTGILQEKPFENRRIFRLINPLLTEETPLDDARLWWAGSWDQGKN